MISKIALPVRFTANEGVGHAFDTLVLSPDSTALLLVDCDGDCGVACNQVINENIAPALQAARAIAITPIFIYGDGWLPDGVNSLAREYHRQRRGLSPDEEQWGPYTPGQAVLPQ